MSLFRLELEPLTLREHLLAQDVIYVGGGSMINLLAIWRAHGRRRDPPRGVAAPGSCCAGLSAGVDVLVRARDHDVGPGQPAITQGLGVPGGRATRSTTTRRARPPAARSWQAVAAARCPAATGVDDGVGLLFRGTRLAEVVAARPGLRAFRVDAVEGAAREHELEPRVLAGREHLPPGAVPHDIGELRLLRAARRQQRH